MEPVSDDYDIVSASEYEFFFFVCLLAKVFT